MIEIEFNEGDEIPGRTARETRPFRHFGHAETTTDRGFPGADTSLPAEEREDSHQLFVRRLSAILANLEALGVFDGFTLLFTQELDQLGAEPVRQRTVCCFATRSRIQSSRAVFSLGTSAR